MSVWTMILISAVAGTILSTLLAGVLIFLFRTLAPERQTRIRRLLFPARDLDVLPRRQAAIEQRLSGLDRTSREQIKNLEREIETGRKAERALVEILKGLTQSALRSDERLSALEKNESPRGSATSLEN
jgi:septal ring factor EnvC (AmiA/AmiB activator)